MSFDPGQPGGRRLDPPAFEEDADIPPPPRGLAADPIDEDSQERLERISRRGRALPALLVVAAIGAFIGIVWWAYSTANSGATPDELPVVTAEPGEEKVRPESEGGLDVPNQDKLIYQQLGQGENQPEVERLLPPPEEPLAPPPPPPVEEEPATAALTPPPPPQETPDEVIPDDAPADADAAAAPDDPAPDATATQSATTEHAAADAVPQAAPTTTVEAAPAAPAEVPASEPTDAAAAEAPAEPAPQVAAATGAFRVQLAAVKEEASARNEWQRLQKVHAELLGSLEPTIQRADLGAQGIFYRIQGGPLPSRDAADALCAQLKKKNQACLVVAP